MTYHVLFRVEKEGLIPKLLGKLENVQRYFEGQGDSVVAEAVLAGPVVKVFSGDYQALVRHDLDVAVCHNALKGHGLADIQAGNIRTVRAGIGEIIQKKAQGWIEYTIE